MIKNAEVEGLHQRFGGGISCSSCYVILKLFVSGQWKMRKGCGVSNVRKNDEDQQK